MKGGLNYFGRVDLLVLYTAEFSSSQAGAVEYGCSIGEVCENLIDVGIFSLEELGAFFS